MVELRDQVDINFFGAGHVMSFDAIIINVHIGSVLRVQKKYIWLFEYKSACLGLQLAE